MLNKQDRHILWASVHNVGGYPIFPQALLKVLNIEDNKYYRDYLIDTLSNYTVNEEIVLSPNDKTSTAASLYACILFMDENDAGAVMDCSLADLRETYKKILHEWNIKEEDYKPMLDKIKNS